MNKILFVLAILLGIIIIVCPIFLVCHAEEVKIVTINADKTYKQCEREAFNKVYEAVNKSLDNMVDEGQTKE